MVDHRFGVYTVMATKVRNTSATKNATQAAFDRAVFWLLRQGRPAVNRAGSSVYKAANGARCGVGHLLTSRELNHLHRGKKLATTLETLSRVFVEKVVRRLGVEEHFLVALQEAHDSPDPKDWQSSWKANMRGLARVYGLSDRVLK